MYRYEFDVDAILILARSWCHNRGRPHIAIRATLYLWSWVHGDTWYILYVNMIVLLRAGNCNPYTWSMPSGKTWPRSRRLASMVVQHVQRDGRRFLLRHDARLFVIYLAHCYIESICSYRLRLSPRLQQQLSSRRSLVTKSSISGMY
jgi:hypothetical protein